MEFNKFTEEIQDLLVKVQSGFDIYQTECFTPRGPEFFCLELNGEAGELANLEKKQWKGRNIEHKQYEDEAADVLIALMNYCNARKVNLGIAVNTKLKKIEEIRKSLADKEQSY